MPVYVEQPRADPRDTKLTAGTPLCNMYADTLDELHAMARALGLPQTIMQGAQTVERYELSLRGREQAIGLGAVQHNRVEAVAKWRELRKKRNEERERAERDQREGTLW